MNLYVKLYIFGKISTRSFRIYIVLYTFETCERRYAQKTVEKSPNLYEITKKSNFKIIVDFANKI